LHAPLPRGIPGGWQHVFKDRQGVDG
jgi:hypothetical protein